MVELVFFIYGFGARRVLGAGGRDSRGFSFGIVFCVFLAVLVCFFF